MKVTLNQVAMGSFCGQPGDVVDVDDEVGAHMLETGQAEPVAGEKPFAKKKDSDQKEPDGSKKGSSSSGSSGK